MKSAKKFRKLKRFCYVLCVVFLITMDMVALANVVEMDIVYPCSGTKRTGSELGFTYNKSQTKTWSVVATHAYTGVQFYATVLCSYNNGILGIGKKDSCKVTSASPNGVCCYGGVQCGGAMKFTNTVAGQFQSSTATVSHEADDATFRVVFGSY